MPSHFSKTILCGAVGALVALTGCERVEEVPEVMTPVAPAKLLPPPQATGFEIATLRITPPRGNEGREIYAGLKYEGRLVGRGEASIAKTGITEVVVRALNKSVSLKDGNHDLWLAIDRDGLAACHPSFGDLYLRDQWVWPKVAKLMDYADPVAWKYRRLERAENLITIHYHRYDADYADLGIWSWDAHHEKSPADNELLEVGRDDYGLIFQFDRGEYGATGQSDKIGLLARLHADWGQKDGPDKFWTPALGNEIWLIGGDTQIYTQRPDLAPRVVNALVDRRDQLVVTVTRPLKDGELAPADIQITGRDGVLVPVTSAGRPKSPANAIEVTLGAPLDIVGNTYTVGVTGFAGAVALTPRRILDDAELFSDRHAVMGATYAPAQTTFRVFAPTAREVSVVLYDEATGQAGRRVTSMQHAGKGIWSTTVTGDLAGKFYVYSLTGEGLSPANEVVDIYAVNTVDSTRRARITDLTQTNPPGWGAPQRGPRVTSPVDMVVYEMHVRDFSIAPSSGMANKGQYLAFTEAGTHLPGDPSIKTGLDHLVELGITHVQLLPIQDFENNESSTNYNWGYITMAFHSPEGWFATNPRDDSRIREFKALVQALHDRGLGVILDVVYNHTAGNAPFNSLVPGYYYRHTPDGRLANGSGCGNDFRTEAPMARKYVVDSLKYWVEEYGIDGYRFDLMALLDLETMKEAERELRKIRPDIVLYGEPWAAGPVSAPVPTNKRTISGTGYGAFNDNMRNSLVGSPFDEAHGGFVQDGGHRDQLQRAIQGQWRDWGDGPHQVIQYMSCHDNYVVYDKIKASKPGASHADILEMMKLGYLLLFTSQGVPFIHGGEEFARTKNGHHNSYDAPDSINQVDWAMKKDNLALSNYVRDLIALRKAHPAFRIRPKEQIAAWLKFHETADANVLLYTIDATHVAGEPWKQIAVIANANDSLSVEVPLPPGNWRVGFDHAGPGQGNVIVTGQVRVRYKSGMVLYQP
jgi:pullulanase